MSAFIENVEVWVHAIYSDSRLRGPHLTIGRWSLVAFNVERSCLLFSRHWWNIMQIWRLRILSAKLPLLQVCVVVITRFKGKAKDNLSSRYKMEWIFCDASILVCSLFNSSNWASMYYILGQYLGNMSIWISFLLVRIVLIGRNRIIMRREKLLKRRIWYSIIYPAMNNDIATFGS